MEWFLLYLFVMVESLTKLLALGWPLMVFGAFAFGAAFLAAIIEASSYNGTPFGETWNDTASATYKIRKIAKPMIIVGLIFGSISMLIPNQRGLAIIVGGSMTYQAVTSETGKRLGGKAVEALEKKLDEALADPIPVVTKTVEAATK